MAKKWDDWDSMSSNPSAAKKESLESVSGKRGSPDARSRNMSAVRARDTKPERLVRRAAHKLGLRYQLIRRDLPGKPDLTFPRWRTVLFVHGCFWHQHPGCPRSGLPKTNRAFWEEKLTNNVRRDARDQGLLELGGWRVLVLWECEVYRSDVNRRLLSWFQNTDSPLQESATIP